MSEEKDFETLDSELEMAADLAEEVDMDSDSDEVEAQDIEVEAGIFLQEEEESETFLPEASDEELDAEEISADAVDIEGTELDGFDSAEIEDVEFVEEERLESIIESVLFASDRPTSLASLKLLFKGTSVRGDKIRRALDQLAVEYAGGRRGVTLEEVPGGYQLRTKIDNMEFLKRTLKARQFKLSGPALEVLSIVAYKQPTVKIEVDEIRGVESGHLLRALMEKNLVCFEGKSELPGRPMQYGTTKKFLEIFGLRSLKELPTLSQIDELLPEGIDEHLVEEKPTLASITDSMSQHILGEYSAGEDELMKIEAQLGDIATTTNFFEEEKRRQAEKRDHDKAQVIRDALVMEEPVTNRDQNWLIKYDEAIAAGTTLVRMKEEESAKRKEAFANKVKKAPALDEEGNLIEEISAEESESVENLEASSDDSDDNSEEESSELGEAIERFDSDADLEGASDDQLFADADDEESDDEDQELPFLGEADDIDEEGEANT